MLGIAGDVSRGIGVRTWPSEAGVGMRAKHANAGTVVESPRVPGLTADVEDAGRPGRGSGKRCQGALRGFLKGRASESVGCMF